MQYINPCGEQLINSREAINKIYGSNKEFHKKEIRIRKSKKRENLKNSKILKKKKAKEEKIRKWEEEKRYLRAYEIAIINNDRKEMERIEKIVGHPPCQRSRGYTTACRKGRISNKSFNPKPLNGGGFSPK